MWINGTGQLNFTVPNSMEEAACYSHAMLAKVFTAPTLDIAWQKEIGPGAGLKESRGNLGIEKILTLSVQLEFNAVYESKCLCGSCDTYITIESEMVK